MRRFTSTYRMTNTVTKDTTVGPSPRRMASKSVLPTPGTLKIPSVTVAPTSSTPKFVAELVMTGISELRSTCTGSTRLRESPLL